MADLPTEFWGGWIVVLTIVSLAAVVWLILSVYFTPESEDPSPTETWDETLEEGRKPAPMWWFWLTVALLAVSVVYLMLYPGLGTFRGALEWSQGGEIEQKLEQYAEQFGPERRRLAAASIDEIRADDTAMNSAWRIFNINCTPCHGADATGQADLFPDLSDAAWQWGGSEAQITQTIAMGRQAVMPPWQAALNDEGVAALTDYVIALSEGRGGEAGQTEAASMYTTYCSACHGPDGSGNALLGAPALNDSAWLYGSDADAVAASIAIGRNGIMPGFAARLDETQIRLLTAWLRDGARPRLAAPPP
jgi:cytochrome c oxidase cbb3-type subunit 3